MQGGKKEPAATRMTMTVPLNLASIPMQKRELLRQMPFPATSRIRNLILLQQENQGIQRQAHQEQERRKDL